MEQGLSRVVQGGFWLYMANIANNVFGFIYWLVISAVAGPGVVGTVSAVVGLSGLFSGILSLGVPTGLSHILGEALGGGDRKRASESFWSSIALEGSLLTSAALALFAVGFLGWGVGGYTPKMFTFAAIFLVLGISGVFQAMFTGFLELFPCFLATLVGNVLKVVVGIALVFLGFGWVGAAIGYAMISLSLAVFGFLYGVRTLGFCSPSRRRVLEVVRAGVPSWAPTVVTLVGRQVAVIAVFSSVGAVETGRFYVAMTVAGFVSGLAGSLQGVMLPYLSGLADGRKRAAWRVLRVSIALVSPLVAGVMAAPGGFLGLLGRGFSGAWPLLIIMLIACLAVVPASAVVNLCYAYHRYRDVLIIGLATSLPRILLYVALAPLYGSLGVAAAFAVGSMAGLAVASRRGEVLGFRIGWGELLQAMAVLAVASAVGAGVRLVAPWWLAAACAVALGYVGVMKLGLLGRGDIVEVGRALVPRRLRPFVSSVVEPLLDAVYG